MNSKERHFQYPEDKSFYISFLANGDKNEFYEKFNNSFDILTDPKVKRKEFNKIRNEVFRKLTAKYGKKCQLRIHPDCSKINKFDVDHIIPLSTNELNKHLRRMERTDWHKVPPQSFGSNNIQNLIIACSRCNAYKKHRIVKNGVFAFSKQKDSFEFLSPYRSDDEILILPSGKKVPIIKYFLRFKEWKGKPIKNTYGHKAVLDVNGESVFAELAALRLLQSHGWRGVWVDSYRKKFRIGMPELQDPIEIPSKQKKFIDSIRKKTGKFGGCWDVLAWNSKQIIFLELKRHKKDQFQESQKIWLEKCLESGLSADSFRVIEWSS